MADNRDRLIVALDVGNALQAREIVAKVGAFASTYKVGKQLFTAEGPQVVRDLVASGRKVFLDLKYHDIPNTVGKAVREACALGVSLLTVHAAGGSRMLRAAVEAAASSSSKPLILAVTVLTSFSDDDLKEVGVPASVLEQAQRMARLAQSCGCGGVVTSPREARALRQLLGPGPAIVTPGVRPAGSDKGDQQRVATPKEAIAAGASHIVVGRPITAAKDPAGAARAILDEIGG
ncbi:MAG TPA: orotidine-5'-phosphate decarboxylase [Terriglobales bacterium]|jgi:orotidine-5'-phosphate decarboxylase|nr:orotidine-5'-phosphate decarboxylase [Terriglobales bacterium]